MVGYRVHPGSVLLPRFGLATLLLILLAACAAPQRRTDVAAVDGQLGRERALSAMTDWSLRGRMAVSGDGDGGSGQLHWTQQAGRTEFEVRAPVSRQTWRLIVENGEARIEGLEGGVRRGRDAGELIRREIGWNLPLQSLAAWVRGLRGPGRAHVEFDREGLPALIVQDGWHIEYRGWDRDHVPPLPSKVFASRGDRRVRLSIADWTIAR